ncbi:HAMP domain-containing protein [Bremerella cremea]|uniref:HAMP domain-containing protein n=1 Tax=Bremerella cremea TaxID=1031537 RepID=A0A368KM85_9BACT|nr:methyl-accepting chemotaxis protein [Bremerella cremea]RCS40747.1 HAMP domain-containing protein [Bremerella cremea]
MLSRLNIMQKTILGFGTVLLLMIVSGFVAWNGTRRASEGFDEYRRKTLNASTCSDALVEMMQLRFLVKSFDFTGDPAVVEHFNKLETKISSQLQQAEQSIRNPQRRAKVVEIENAVQQYSDAFTEVAESRLKRDQLWSGTIAGKGSSIAQNLLLVIDSESNDPQTKSEKAAVASLNNLMRARVGLYRLIYTTDMNYKTDALEALTQLKASLAQLDSLTENPESKRLIAQMILDTNAYQEGFEQLSAALANERSLVAEKLDLIGPHVAELAQTINREIADDQQELGAQVQAANQTTLWVLPFVSIAALMIGAILAIVLSRSIVLPIRRVMTILGHVSDGDLRQRLEVKSHDEIGSMSNSLNHMVENLQKAMTALSQNSQAIARSAEDMNSTADNMTNISHETKTQSTSAAAAAEELSVNMRTMSEMSLDMSKNMDIVASAVEEMSISINQIAANMDQVSHVASEAHRLTEGSRNQLSQLNLAANEIGDVVELIQDIAEQTNLLALNATIEAARAGEAGKGFAVVAGEVKELARQTGDATGDIERRVSSMQSSSNESMQSIDAIREVIEKLNSISQSVAAAVEEQSATTQEIANNVARTNEAVQQVSQSVNESATAGEEIARSVASVDTSALRVSEGAGQTKSCSGTLGGISQQLQTLVGQFQV